MTTRLSCTLARLRTLSIVGALALGGIVTVAPAAQAGLVDGSFNNAHVLDHGNVLGVMLNSTIFDSSNNNANTRSRAAHVRSALNPASSCTVIVHAADPDGAEGTMAVAVSEGDAQTEVRIPDANSAVGYRAGDTDHFAGTIVCTDTATGEVTALLDVSDYLVAS